MILATFLESRLLFVVWANLGIPVQSLLAALIIRKSSLRKDIKAIGEPEATAGEGTKGRSLSINEDSRPVGTDVVMDSNKEGDVEIGQTASQSAVNLVGVDVKRVADFCGFLYIFPGTIINIVISTILLLYIIGWAPLFSGLAAFLLLTPINIWCSKKYNFLQEKLMKVRDQKLGIVTEALRGIRQIKFTATEDEWRDKIMKKRKSELETQNKCYRSLTGVSSFSLYL